MTGIEIIILIGLVVILAAGIGYYMTKGQPSLKEMTKDYYNNEEAQELADLAKELYNKDLRPIVAKKETLTKKSKEKIIESITNTGEYVAPKKEKVVEVTPEPTPVQVEIVVEEVKKETKSEFPIDKPKKKRKYYPKKK